MGKEEKHSIALSSDVSLLVCLCLWTMTFAGTSQLFFFFYFDEIVKLKGSGVGIFLMPIKKGGRGWSWVFFFL